MNRLFVYGTLKRGDVRHHFLHEARYLGEASTAPRYRLLTHGPYPALIEAEAINQPGLAIQGELYDVDAATLARIDLEEGVDEGLYARRAIQLAKPQDHAVESYFYLHDVAGMTDCGVCW